jgi:hypothetical protein
MDIQINNYIFFFSTTFRISICNNIYIQNGREICKAYQYKNGFAKLGVSRNLGGIIFTYPILILR